VAALAARAGHDPHRALAKRLRSSSRIEMSSTSSRVAIHVRRASIKTPRFEIAVGNFIVSAIDVAAIVRAARALWQIARMRFAARSKSLRASIRANLPSPLADI